MPILTCPLPSDWQTRLDNTFMFAKFSSQEEEQRLQAAHEMPRGSKIRDVETVWEVAPDDCTGLPARDDTHFSPGYPRHVHTEFTIDGNLIHIDRIWDKSFGPLHGNTQIYIFINGVLEGLGHSGGSSLGASTSIMPAVAVVNLQMAIMVAGPQNRPDDASSLYCADPEAIAVYAIKKLRAKE